MPLSPKFYQILCGVFASLGSFTFGYDLGVIGGAVASKSFVSTMSEPSANEIGAVVSLFTGGAFFGAMFAGPTGDWLGRRLTILIGALIFVLGGVVQATGQNLGYLYSGRAIAGLGVGCLVMIIPLYQAEIAHPSIRGRITALQQFMLGIGATLAVWICFGTNHLDATNNNQWRIPLGLQAVPAGILALLILLFPESPRWLLANNKEELGLKTLARLHAHGNEQDAFVLSEHAAIQSAIAYDREHEAKSYMELIRNPSCFRRLVLAMACQAACQMTGVSAIQYFTPEIYETINIGTTDALKYQGISNVLSVLAQLCTILFIDRLGRRWTLICGNLFNCVCFITVTAAIASFQATTSISKQNSLGWLFIVANWFYQISFSFTSGPLSWIIPAEIFDTQMRSKGVSIATMTSFAFNTLIGQVTAPAMESIGWRYFLLFVICNFTNAVFFWAFLPETAKLPLESMNELFSGPWFVPGSDSKTFRAHAIAQHGVADEKLADEKLEDTISVHEHAKA